MEKKKLLKIIGWSVYGLLAIGVIVTFILSSKIFGKDTVFVAKESWNDVGKYLFATAIPAIIRTIRFLNNIMPSPSVFHDIVLICIILYQIFRHCILVSDEITKART